MSERTESSLRAHNPSEGEPRPATANGGNAAHKTESGQRGTAGRDVGTLAPSPDAATEPSTDMRASLEGRIGIHLGLWEGVLDVGGGLEKRQRFVAYIADLVEAEARAASVPPALDDATRLRDWIAKHRTVCPIMRESAEKLHALLAAETPEPEASDD